jgi:hypothetical protein
VCSRVYTAAQDGEVEPSKERVRVVMSVGLVVVVSLPWSLANDLGSFEGVQAGPPALPPRSRGGWGGVVEPDRGEANWVWPFRVP